MAITRSKSTKKLYSLFHRHNSCGKKKSYINCRQSRKEPEEHKKLINKFGARQLMIHSVLPILNCLIIDTDLSNSRRSLVDIGIPDSNIETVDISTEKDHLPTHFKRNFIDHAEVTMKGYDYVFADCINNYSNSIKQFRPLLRRKKINNKGVVGITFCPRGAKNSSNYFQGKIINDGKKYGYNLKPLHVPPELVRGKTKNGKIKILPNWTDNSEFEKTGRTITAFFRAHLI